MKRAVFLACFCLLFLVGFTFSVPAGFAASRVEWEKSYKDWQQKTYDLAKKEGKAVWYTDDLKPCADAIADAFGKKYPGVKLEVLAGRGREISARIITEQNAKKLLGDYMSTGLITVRLLAIEDRLDPFVPPSAREPGVAWVMDPFQEQQNFKGKPFPLIQNADANGMIINTNLVPKDREPKSWMDLLDPWWKGKIVCDDPRVMGGGNKLFFWMRKAHGEEYWKKLAAQNVTFVQQTYDKARSVASGEYYLSLGATGREYKHIRGGPVKWVAPSEGTYVTQNGGCFMKGCPHPNATALFMDFIYSRACQDIWGMTGGRTPVRPDAKTEVPEQNLAGKKVLISTIEEDELVNEARDSIKKYIGK